MLDVFKMEISFNSLMARVLRDMQKVDIAGDDACLIVNGDNNVLLRVNKPLYVRINGNNVGMVHGQMHIGVLTKTNINFIDTYKSGYKKVIELSEQPFEDSQKEQKKPTSKQKIISLSDFI